MQLPNLFRVAMVTWWILATLFVQGCGGGGDGGGGNPLPSSGGLPTADTTAPTVPQNLAATAIGTTQVNLTWAASTDSGGAGLAGYRVLRGGVEIATTAQTNFSNTGLTPNTAYSYTVRAYDNATPANISANSLFANVTTLALDTTAPTVPQSLVATTVSSTQVNLTWSPSTDSGGSGLAGYRVFRGGVQVATTAATSYSNTGLMPNTAYTYTVRAYDNATPGNVSADSSPPANVTTLAAPDTTAPTVPQNALATAISSSQVNLTWTASTDSGGSGLAGYRVFRDSAQIATTAATNYSNTGLAASTTYTYTVRHTTTRRRPTSQQIPRPPMSRHQPGWSGDSTRGPSIRPASLARGQRVRIPQACSAYSPRSRLAHRSSRCRRPVTARAGLL